MKKILSLLLSMMCLVCVIFAFAGCNIDSLNNGDASASSGSEDIGTSTNDDSETSQTKYSFADTYYLATTKATQASETVATDDGNTITQKAELIDSQVAGNYMLMQYKIGTIYRCFIETLSTAFYNDGAIGTLTYEESYLTASSISSGLSKSISTTDSVSITQSKKDSVTADISFTAGVSIYNIFSFDLAVKVARSTEYGASGTIAEAISESATTSYETTNLVQTVKSTSYEYDITKYETGYYYALSLLANVDVYQIIVYNMVTGEFDSSCFATSVDRTNSYIEVLSSENGSFEVTSEYQLSPITEADIPDEVIDSSQTVTIDLTEYYTYEIADLSNYTHEYYDNATGIFYVYGSYDGRTVSKYIFKGMYGVVDSKGRTVRTTINGFSICIFSEHDIEIKLENMSFVSVDGYAGIYLDDRTESSNQVITITSSGLGNYIYGADGDSATSKGKTGDDGQDAVNLSYLIIEGNVPLTLVGGNGGNGSDGSGYSVTDYGTAKRNGLDGGNGGNGGAAISSKSLTINMEASIYCIGGDGGNGGAGGNGGGSDADGTATAGSGGDGGNGGVGGNAIYTNIICVPSSKTSITLASGSGGNGGTGGAGGWGKDANKRDSGGTGGTGGNGGNSGYCIYSTTNDISSVISLNSGNGGDGGKGGNGGNAYRDSVSGSWTYIGDGGNGGNGGDCNILSVAISESYYTLVGAKSGNGGDGGTAGDGGTGVGAINYGTGGTGGSSGDIVLSLGVTAVSGNSGTAGTKAVAGAGGSGGTSVSIS